METQITTVGINTAVSIMPPLASLEGHGREILWNIPHPHVNLHFGHLHFFPFLCTYHNGSLHFFCCFIWIFPLCLLKVSPMFPHLCILCVLYLCQHPPPSTLLTLPFMCLQANPLSWQQPWTHFALSSLTI